MGPSVAATRWACLCGAIHRFPYNRRMKIAKVVRHVIATQKHSFYEGKKTFIVAMVDPEGNRTGAIAVAVDRVQAGLGDTVLVMQEGSSARHMFNDPEAPVRSTIVGIIDHIDMA